MNNGPQPGTAYKSLKILYFGILISTILLAAVIYFIGDNNTEPVFAGDSHREMLVFVLFLTAACLAISGYKWKRSIAKIREMLDITSKVRAYQSASIKRYVLTEAPVLFAIVCYSFTENIRFMVVVLLLIVAFLLMYPSASRIASDIGEDAGEIQKL